MSSSMMALPVLWALGPYSLLSEPGINFPANIANILGQLCFQNDRSLEKKSRDGAFCPSASQGLSEILDLSQTILSICSSVETSNQLEFLLWDCCNLHLLACLFLPSGPFMDLSFLLNCHDMRGYKALSLSTAGTSWQEMCWWESWRNQQVHWHTL